MQIERPDPDKPAFTCSHSRDKLSSAVVHTEVYNGKMQVISSVACLCGASWTATDYDAVRTDEVKRLVS